MREIKFRGKRKTDGKWLYGNLAKVNLDVADEPFVYSIFSDDWEDIAQGEICEDWYLVDPETVGQFIGLNDKSDKEIYEGDIVYDKYGLLLEVRFGKFPDTKYHTQVGFYLYDFKEKINRGNLCFDWDEKCNLEIIGNIHENPELLTK